MITRHILFEYKHALQKVYVKRSAQLNDHVYVAHSDQCVRSKIYFVISFFKFYDHDKIKQHQNEWHINKKYIWIDSELFLRKCICNEC